MTVLTALEVIVLAFGAFPAAFREGIVDVLFLPLRLRWPVFRLPFGINGSLGDAGLGEDGLGGGHPLTGRHEDLGNEFTADRILTNTIIRLRDGGPELANGIGW